MQAMDQPTTDGINSYFISKYAHEYGLTAVLSASVPMNYSVVILPVKMSAWKTALQNFPVVFFSLSAHAHADRYKKK